MTPQKTISAQAWAQLLLLSLFWGASFLSIRIALDEIGPFTVVLHRTFWAALVVWAVVAAMRLPVPRAPSVWGAFLVMGLLNNAIPFSLMAWGQLHIETGLTSILNASAAVFGVIVAAVFFADERLGPRRAAGVALGFAGVVTVIGPDRLLSFDPRSLAQLAVLGGAFSYALAGAWARRTLSYLPPQVAAAGMLSGSVLLILPLALYEGGVPSAALAPRTWAALAYMALIATAGAYLLYYRILASAGSGNVLLVTLLVTPTAILLGAVVRGEELGLGAYLGFALLALGLSVLDGRLWRRARVAPPQ